MSTSYSSNTCPEPFELLPVYRALGFTEKTLSEFLSILRKKYEKTSTQAKERITYVELRKFIDRTLKDPEMLEALWKSKNTPRQFKVMINSVLPGDNGDALIAQDRHGELLDAFKRAATEYADYNLSIRDNRSPEQKANLLLVLDIMAEFIRRTGRLPTIDGRTG